MSISVRSGSSESKSTRRKSEVAHAAADIGDTPYNNWESFIGLWERANLIRSFVWSHESSDETALFNQFLVRVRRFFNIDFCFIALLQEGGKIIQVGVPEAALGHLPADFVRRSLDIVANSRIPVTWKQFHAKTGFRTVVVSPLSPSVGEPLGFLMLGHTRGRSFTRAELFLLQSMAGELSWAIRELRSKQSHQKLLAAGSLELKNSLHMVLGNCSRLREDEAGVLTTGQDQRLTDIEKGTRESLRTISSFLDFALAHEGRSPVLYECIDLVESIENTLLSCREKAKQAGLKLETEYADNLPRQYSTDPVRFRHVLRNLADHAIESSERGPVIIRVRKNAEFIEFYVKANEPREAGVISEPSAEVEPCGHHAGESVYDRLEMIRENLKLLNGHLHNVKRQSEGFEVSICLP
jgi:signal transduction histidine kinase